MAAPNPSSNSLTSTSTAAVSLPPRTKAANASASANSGSAAPTSAAPVWSLQAGPETSLNGSANADVPLASKCDQHNRERTICCRELKGDDERSLIDPDVVRDIICRTNRREDRVRPQGAAVLPLVEHLGPGHRCRSCCRSLVAETFADDHPGVHLADSHTLCPGLTVPFGLCAGLSSLGSSRLVYIAGIAELVSGSLSMGVGGYLSAQAERDHYRYLKKNTRVSSGDWTYKRSVDRKLNSSFFELQDRVKRSCAGEMEREVSAILSPLGIDDSISRRVAGSLLKVEATLPAPQAPPSIMSQCLKAIARKPRFSSSRDEERQALLAQSNDEDEDEKGLTAFLLKFGEGLEETTDLRLFMSALTIGFSYFLGGLIPLLPYFFVETAQQGLFISVIITGIVLILFGGFKTYYTGAAIGASGYAWGALSTLAVGGAAAAASFAIVKALPEENR
ncbi:BZ3500_MvSof-1268-A1-R1_Chr5-2g07858 [Microbotryum saponariae]|uniref:BZ3500_MvSof-1268-A1-R1_Chr5-2g07858 protein n=1 Tax=Microbotryum saponariae TaxID=289078 RepID=A0A2X0ME63_9BASI|nr:BZ3500_MvSof-1268-A1-R1_Chr5-2g07858 [Microbotryum saponariae]SDA05727.1 BZ3501_MvSof-1269-A2-R1_Chr5-2g07680 [Microbotryum saponariae]